MILLALDVGTTQTGYCFINTESYVPIVFDKALNENAMHLVKWFNYDILVYEQFESFGMPIGKEVLESAKWNGRYIQVALDRGKNVDYVTRKEEKLNICGSVKANDTNIRHALIDRFAKHDFRTGKGTKKNQDFFYGFKADVWSAYAVGITWLDKEKRKRLC